MYEIVHSKFQPERYSLYRYTSKISNLKKLSLLIILNLVNKENI